MSASLQIILPGLFDLPLEELEAGFVRDELPALNRILGRAAARENSDFTIDAIIRNAMDIAPGVAGLPVAQAFAADEEASPGRLILAEAVHLRADMHDALVVPISKTEEDLDQINIIINDLNDLFNVDYHCEAVGEGVYLLRFNDFDAPTHYPQVLSVLGKPVNPYIEQSRQVLPWYRLLNEIQMFMHQHPVNAERMQAGRLPINSLWFWGAGAAPRVDPELRWFCDDALLSRFASGLGLQVESCSGLDNSDAFDKGLVIDLRLLQWLKAGLEGGLDEILLDIERGLLASAMEKYDKGSLTLFIRAGYAFDFELGPAAKLKFWRRPGSLEDWRQGLNE